MKQYEKNNFRIFSQLFLILTFFTILSYIFNLYLNQENFYFYYCDEVVNYDINLNGSSLNLNYVFSCDEPKYFYILDNPSLILSAENYYQQRPLYLLSAILIKVTLTGIFSVFQLTIPLVNQLSFLILQILILATQGMVLRKIITNFNNVSVVNNGILSLIVFLNPMNKWSLFQPGHQNLTTLIFIVGVYILQNKRNESLFLPLFIGVMFLFHRSAAILVLVMLLKNILNFESFKKYFTDILKILSNFSVPYLLFRISIFTSGNILNDNQVGEYKQFTWILDFILGKDTIYSGITTGWYCQKIPNFLLCYFIDNIKTIIYLSTIIILILILRKDANLSKLSFDKFRPIILNFLLFYLFWMFIGWYPPVRFSFYSIGNLVIILFTTLFFSMSDRYVKNISLLIYSYFFLLINHWNSPKILELTIINTIVLVFLFGILFFKSRNFKIFSK